MRVLNGKARLAANVDHDAALEEMVSVVQEVMTWDAFRMASERDAAREIVETMVYEKPHLWQRLSYDKPPPRVWYYSGGDITVGAPWFERGGDEYGNRPWCFRIPFAGQVCVVVGRLKTQVEDPRADPDSL